ncbi:hypothetical protein KKC17_01640 [Patescibacteria group bacterium]|nr:hypothetical protein [Patescibacteria group bacterium]
MKNKIIISLILVGLIVVSRLMPHIWNVAPVAAAALLAGALLPRKWALAVPLTGMLLADIVIGFYHWPVMLAVYGSFTFIGLMGAYLKKFSAGKLVAFSLASSTLFFIVTNLAVWATASWYPKTLEGLIMAYTLAIPFFRNTMIGDLMFTGVLFGVYSLVLYLVKLKNYHLSLFKVLSNSSLK